MKLVLLNLVIVAIVFQAASAASLVIAQDAAPATVTLEAIPQLVAGLNGEQLWITTQMHVIRQTPAKDAAAAIVRLGPEAIPSLAAAGAASENPTIRANVVWILAGFRKPEAVPALIKATKDEDATVRQQAATGLQTRNDMDAVMTLLPLLNDSAVNVRAAAAAALGGAAAQSKPGEPISNYDQGTVVAALAKLLPDKEPGVRGSAARALGELKNSNCVPKLTLLLKTETESNVRIAIVQALGAINDRSAAPALIAFVERERDSTPRALAIQSLAVLRDVRATTLLIEMLTDSDEVVQWNAAWALGKIGDRRATPHLIRALAAPDSRRLNIAAAEALGDIADPLAVEPLIAALQNKETAYQAARGLGELRDPRAIAPLVRTLMETEQQTVQNAVVGALKRIPSPQVVRRLTEACLAAKKQDYKTALARHLVAELTGAHVPESDPFGDEPSDSTSAFRAWWQENEKYFPLAEAEKR